jgi:outer membrane protein OmpA-like peptidoglycan-associated protein
VIEGAQTSRDISFEDNRKMRISDDEQEEVFLGAGLGIKYSVGEQIDLMVDIDVRGAERAMSYGANIGLKYKFNTLTKKVKPKNVQNKAKRREAESRKIMIEVNKNQNPVEKIKNDAMKKRDIAKAKEIKEASKASFILKSALFNSNSIKLDEATKKKLRTMAREIRKMNYKTLVIEGHTDSSGNEDRNRKLSIERAKAVYTELLRNGIPAQKMKYMGFGSSVSIGDNKTPAGRAKNRRVEILVL